MKKGKQLTNSEIASFCEQMAMIIKAGITPKDGLAILLSDTKDESTKSLLQTMLISSALGETFTTSIKESGVFPEYVVHMISIGEETGRMDDVMQSLSEYYEHEDNISESIRSAITYPLIMIIMMLIIIAVIISKVLPLFNQVFIQLGTHMDGFSASLLQLGESIQAYSFAFFALLFLLVIFYFYVTRTARGKAFLMKTASKIKPLKNFYDSVSYGRFASGMALMLNSGMGIFQSLDMVKQLSGDPSMEEKIIRCRDHIKDGDSFAEALQKESFFNNLYARMIALGIKTGNLDSVLAKIATIYEEETDKKIRNFISILEPTLVISLSLVVGLILLSVILPLLSIMTSIG